MCSGCSGSATVQFVSLNAARIDPPPAKIWRYDAKEAYWWTDEADELNIALRSRKSNPLLGELGDSELDISIVLSALPAGSGKDYSIRRRETRTVLITAIGRQRYSSYAGVMDVLVDDDHHIHGSFRIWLRPQSPVLSLSPLPQRPGSVLAFGTFHAVKNRKRGAAIRTVAESRGGQRKARPPAATSQRASGADRK